MDKNLLNETNTNFKMSEKELINIIESNDKKTWTTAKHSSADKLLELYDTKNNRNFLWTMFKVTGDYYYCSILKNVKELS